MTEFFGDGAFFLTTVIEEMVRKNDEGVADVAETFREMDVLAQNFLRTMERNGGALERVYSGPVTQALERSKSAAIAYNDALVAQGVALQNLRSELAQTAQTAVGSGREMEGALRQVARTSHDTANQVVGDQRRMREAIGETTVYMRQQAEVARAMHDPRRELGPAAVAAAAMPYMSRVLPDLGPGPQPAALPPYTAQRIFGSRGESAPGSISNPMVVTIERPEYAGLASRGWPPPGFGGTAGETAAQGQDVGPMVDLLRSIDSQLAQTPAASGSSTTIIYNTQPQLPAGSAPPPEITALAMPWTRLPGALGGGMVFGPGGLPPIAGGAPSYRDPITGQYAPHPGPYVDSAGRYRGVGVTPSDQRNWRFVGEEAGNEIAVRLQNFFEGSSFEQAFSRAMGGALVDAMSRRIPGQLSSYTGVPPGERFLPPGFVWPERPSLPAPGTTVGGAGGYPPNWAPGDGPPLLLGPGGSTGEGLPPAGGGGSGDGGGGPPAGSAGFGDGGMGWGAFLGGLMGHPGGRGRGFPLFGLWGPRVGGGLAAAGSLGSFAGLGIERVLFTALSLAGSAAGGLAGAGTLGLGALGQMAVGQGSDLAVMKSTIADTQALSQAQQKLAEAVAVYGKNSTQAAHAQAALNFQIAALGGPNAVGVKAELQLAKNTNALNTFWDAQTQKARVAASNILEQVVGLGHTFVPLVAQAALQNLTIINNSIKPLFAWLQGPQGIGIWHTLEDNFQRVLPTAIHAFTQGTEVFLRFVSIASNYTGGFISKLDQLFSRLNNLPNSTINTFVQKLVGDFRLWEYFLKLIGEDLVGLFRNDAGLGNSLIATLTGMLKHLNAYEKSARGQASLMSIFQLHKQEVLELVKLFAHLADAFAHVYMAVAPAAIRVMNTIVLPVINEVAKVLSDISKASPLAAEALGALLIGVKFGGWGAISGALSKVLGLFKGVAAEEAIVAGGGAAAGAGAGAGAGAAGAAGAAGGGVLAKLAAAGTKLAERGGAQGAAGFAGLTGTEALALAGGGALSSLATWIPRILKGGIALTIATVLGDLGIHALQPTTTVSIGPGGQTHTTTNQPLGVVGNYGRNLLGNLFAPENAFAQLVQHPSLANAGGVVEGVARMIGAPIVAAFQSIFGGGGGPRTFNVGGGSVIRGSSSFKMSAGDTLNIAEVGHFSHYSALQLQALQSLLERPGIKVKVNGVPQTKADIQKLVGELAAARTKASADLAYVTQMVQLNFQTGSKSLKGLVDDYNTNFRLISHVIGLNTTEGRKLADQNMQLMIANLTHQMATGKISVQKGMAEITKVLRDSSTQGFGTATQRATDYFNTLESLWISGKFKKDPVKFYEDVHKATVQGWDQIQTTEKSNVDAYIQKEQRLHDQGLLKYSEMQDNIHAYQKKANAQSQKDWADWTGNILANIQRAADNGVISQTTGMHQIQNVTVNAWDQIRRSVQNKLKLQEQDAKSSYNRQLTDLQHHYGANYASQQGYQTQAAKLQSQYNDKKHQLQVEANTTEKTDLGHFINNMLSSMEATGKVSYQGAVQVAKELNQVLGPLHATLIPIPSLTAQKAVAYQQYHMQGIGAAQGGLWQIGHPGEAGRDTVPLDVNGYPIRVAPGELLAVINRHQIPDFNARFRDYGGLHGYFSTHRKPHYMESGGLVPGYAAGGVGGGGGSSSSSSSPSGYVYPFPGLSPGRTDEGYDLSGAGPLYALGAGQVTTSSSGTGTGMWGWPGIGGLVYRLSSGPRAGSYVYYNENVTPTVTSGPVRAGQPIATLGSAFPHLEAGWANSSSTGPLTPYNGAPDGTPMPGGVDFTAFIQALASGAPLPAGSSGSVGAIASLVWKAINAPKVRGSGALTDMVRAGLERLASAGNARGRKLVAAANKTSAAAVGGSVGGAGGVGVAAWLAAARPIAAAHGWGSPEVQSWLGIEHYEDSSLSLTAQNPTSPAYGLAQGIDGPAWYPAHGGNATTLVGQLTAMANYIAGRYGTPSAALAYEIANHSYNRGGLVDFAGSFAGGGAVTASRPTMAMFGENGPETAMFIPHYASGGEVVTASTYNDHQAAYAPYVNSGASIARLQTGGSYWWNKLQPGSHWDITYGNNTIDAHVQDWGSGGAGVGGKPRAVDIWIPGASGPLNLPNAANFLGHVSIAPHGSGGGGSGGSGGGQPKPRGATGQTSGGTWYKGSGSSREFWAYNPGSKQYQWFTPAGYQKLTGHSVPAGGGGPTPSSSSSSSSSHHHPKSPIETDPLLFGDDPVGSVRARANRLKKMGFPFDAHPPGDPFNLKGEGLADITKKGFAELLHAVTHFFEGQKPRALMSDINDITRHARHLSNHVLELKSDIFTVKHILHHDHLSHHRREHLLKVLHDDVKRLHDDNKELHRDRRIAAKAMGAELQNYAQDFNQTSAHFSAITSLEGSLGGLGAGTPLSTMGLRNPIVLRAMGLLPKTGKVTDRMIDRAVNTAKAMRGTTPQAYELQADYDQHEVHKYAKDQHDLEILYHKALADHNKTVAKHVLKELQTVTNARIQAEADLQTAQVNQINAIYQKAADKATSEQSATDLVNAITSLSPGAMLSKMGITPQVLKSIGINPGMANVATSVSYFQNLESQQGGQLTPDQVAAAHKAVRDQNRLLERQMGTDEKALDHLEKLLPTLTGTAKTAAQKNIEQLVSSIVQLEGTMQGNTQALKQLTTATNANTTATGQMTGQVAYSYNSQDYLASDNAINVGQV